MARQDGKAVEKPFAGTIGFCQLEHHRLCIQFANSDWFAPDNQQVALRGVKIFVKTTSKGEKDIVRIVVLAVGTPQSLAKRQCVLQSVRGNLPGFRPRAFRDLRRKTDLNQVRWPG